MMDVLESIVRNESMEDALASLALSFGYPDIDRLYSRYRSEVIRSGELMRVYRGLIDKGVLVGHGCSKAGKGPQWKQPDFLTEGTYSALLSD